MYKFSKQVPWRILTTLGVLVVSLNLIGCEDKAKEQKREERAERAEKRAERAEKRAEQAEKRAERMEEKAEEQRAERKKERLEDRKPAPKKQATHAPAPAKPKQTAAPKPVCSNCATVKAIKPIEREGEAGGGGAVVGALLGGVVGNQIGEGDDKDIATVVGAVGGGLVGHQVEKNMKKATVYQITLQQDNGQSRTMEVADAGALKPGARVRIDGKNLVPLPAGK